MAQDGKIIAFNVDDLKIRKVLTDPSGGSATHGPWIDLLGVQSFNLQPEFLTAELPGDGTTIDIFSKLRKLTGQFVGQISFDALEVMLGGTKATSGSSPNEQATYTISGSDLPNYFEFDVQVLYRGGGDASGGDIHFRIYKAKLTNFQYNLANEEYATLQVDWEGAARLSDNLMGQIIENETAATISAGASDTTAPTVSSTVPTDAATGIATSTTVVFNFSEDILFDAGNFTLMRVVSATDLTNVACTVVKTDSNTVTMTPNSALTGSANYVAVAQGVRDLAGNVLAAPSIVNFTTA